MAGNGNEGGRLRRFATTIGDVAEGIRNFFANAIMAVLALLALAIVYEQLRTDVLYVDKIAQIDACKGQAIPTDLGERLATEMSRLQRLTGSANEAGPTVRFRKEPPTVKLGEISVRDVVDYVRSILPYSPAQAVKGAFECAAAADPEAKCDGGCPERVQLRLDLENGEIVRTRPYAVKKQQWDDLVADAAAGVLQAIDPCAFSQIHLVVWSPDPGVDDLQARKLARAEAAAARCAELTTTDPRRHAKSLERWVKLLERSDYAAEGSALYAASVDPGSFDSMLQIADQQVRLGKLEEAEVSLRAAETTAKRVGNQIALARVELSKGLIAYRRSGGPDGAAQLAIARQQYDLALQRLHDRAVEAPDLRAQIELNLGITLRDSWERGQGEASESLTQFRKAILDAPRSAYAHNGLGRSYESIARKATKKDEKLSGLRNAQRAFALATELDPSFWESENNLARVYAELGDFDAARQHHADAALDAPSEGYVYVDWTKTLLKADATTSKDGCALLPEATKRIEQARKLVDRENPYLQEAESLLASETNRCHRSEGR